MARMRRSNEKDRSEGPKTYQHINQALLLHLFSYDPDSGTLSRKRSGTRAKAGPVTRKNDEGYIILSVEGATCLAHRVIWFMVKGTWPESTIDHDNGDKADNRWDNLKPRTFTQNMLNYRSPSKSTTGIRGLRKSGEGWRGCVCYQGKDYYTPTRVWQTSVAKDLSILREHLKIHGPVSLPTFN